MAKELTQDEINERIAILRRFRTLLEQQRNKFKEYLTVLEQQESRINEDNSSSVLAHSLLEEQIVDNIGSLQKVITPLEKLYEESAMKNEDYGLFANEAKMIPTIKKDLAHLQQAVQEQNRKNAQLLKLHLEQMTTTTVPILNPYRGSHSVYAQTKHTASMVNIQG